MAVSTIKAQNVHFVIVSKTITIPANSDYTLDLSADLNRPIKGIVDAYLNTYRLPYVFAGAVKTWISFVSNGYQVRFTNTTTEWTNYTFYAIIAC